MTEKKVCFVIAPRGDVDSETDRRRGLVLNHIIEPAMKKCGYIVRTESEFATNTITSEIIRETLSAPLVIADLSGGNPSVFYNLAVRHAARKPVIQLTSDQRIPFDAIGTRTIRYEINDRNSQRQIIKEIVEQVGMIERNVSPMESPISVAGAAAWEPFGTIQKTLQHLQSTVTTKTKIVEEFLEALQAAETTPKEIRLIIEQLKVSPRVVLLKDSADDLEAACTLIQNVPEGGYISATSTLQGHDADEREIYQTLLNRALEDGVMYRKIICSEKHLALHRYEVWKGEIDHKASLIETEKIKPDAFRLLHYPFPISVDVLISQDSEGECLEMVTSFTGNEGHGGFKTKSLKMIEEWLDVYLERKIIPFAKEHTERVLEHREDCFCFEFLTQLESARQDTLA